MPVCGAYAIRPYPDGRLFSSKWVGRNSIRPIRRPRQGDECGCPVISQGNLLGASGPYGARLWGVCCCALRLRFLFFDRQGRGVLHTPHQMSLKRGRMRVPGYFVGQFIGGIRALSCPFVGRMLLRPYPDSRLFSSKWVGRNSICPIRRLRQGDECGCGVWMSRPFLGLRRGRRGRDGSVFWTAEGPRLPIRQVF